MEDKFIKVGRIYWIKPFPNPGMKSKIRPAIALEKYGTKKFIFIHLGSSEFKEKHSLKATYLFWDLIEKNNFRKIQNDKKTFIHLDASKPELNESIIKPHYDKGYIDIDKSVLKKIRIMYHKRNKELENIWFKKAKISIIKEEFDDAYKFLKLIKNKNPLKHKKLKIEQWIKIKKKQLK